MKHVTPLGVCVRVWKLRESKGGGGGEAWSEKKKSNEKSRIQHSAYRIQQRQPPSQKTNPSSARQQAATALQEASGAAYDGDGSMKIETFFSQIARVHQFPQLTFSCLFLRMGVSRGSSSEMGGFILLIPITFTIA